MGGEGRGTGGGEGGRVFQKFAVKGSREMLAGQERVGFCLFACFEDGRSNSMCDNRNNPIMREKGAGVAGTVQLCPETDQRDGI